MNYSNYIAEEIDKSISYSEYIVENVDKSIGYAEYIAEKIDKSISYSEYATGRQKTKGEIMREERKKKLDILINLNEFNCD